MSKKTATKIEWIGCIMIVEAMLFSHFVIMIPEPIMLAIAIVAFILMATSMVRLKIIEVQEEKI